MKDMKPTFYAVHEKLEEYKYSAQWKADMLKVLKKTYTLGFIISFKVRNVYLCATCDT